MLLVFNMLYTHTLLALLRGEEKTELQTKIDKWKSLKGVRATSLEWQYRDAKKDLCNFIDTHPRFSQVKENAQNSFDQLYSFLISQGCVLRSDTIDEINAENIADEVYRKAQEMMLSNHGLVLESY